MKSSFLAAVLLVVCTATHGGDILIVGGTWNTPAERICTPLYEPLMKEPGWGKVRILKGSISAVTPMDLENVRLVIVGGGTHFALDAHDQAVRSLLVEYVRHGGGLVIVNNYGQMFARTEFNYQLMQAFGGRVLFEKVCVPKGRMYRIGEYFPDTFTYTDRVFPPFNYGVTNVLYCSCYTFNCDHGVVPFLPTEDWRVALSAGLDVPSEQVPEIGLEFFDSRRRKAGFDGDTPIVGVREFGKGRVVWFGSSLILTRPIQSDVTREIAERILFRGTEEGGPVETGRFIRNLFVWAGANADRVDVAKLPPVEVRDAVDKRLGTKWRLFKGVIGPRTNLSIGRSSPEEFIAKAKRMGLDFIAFLEEFSELTPEEFDRLRGICANASDDTFTAWPGFTFQKDDGNRQYAFSTEPMYPGRKWLTSDRKRFISTIYDPAWPDYGISGNVDQSFFYGALSFVNNVGWYMFHESPYRQTDNRNVQSMGVITRVNGTTVETAFDAYRINNRNGQMLLPFALELVDSVDGMDERTYLCEIGMDGVAAFRRFMMSHGCHNGYPGQGAYGCQFVSNGPEIKFRPRRGDYDADCKLLYSERYANWPYTLEVSSTNGISWVEILDGDHVVRHWEVGGENIFRRTGSFAVERQHYLWVRTKDMKGKAAFTRSCNSESFLMRETQCDDRNNQIFYSRQPRKDGGAYYCTIAAYPCTPDKGPWVGRVCPVGFYVFDKKYGMGGDGGHDGSPEDHPDVWLTPSINYGGVVAKSMGRVREFVAGKEGGPHCRPERVVSSGDVLVGDHVLDGVFAFDRRPIIHVWHSLFPVFDSEYADTRARNTLFIPKMDGVVPYQWEQTLTLKQPVPSAAGRAIANFGSLRLSTKQAGSAANLSGVRLDNIAGKKFSMKPGDYLVVKNPVYGSLAVFPLAPIDYDHEVFSVPGDGGVYDSGSTFELRLVVMGMHKFVEDPYAFASEVGKAYGIGGAEPGYRPELEAGKGRPHGVCFDAIADGGVLKGRFAGLSNMPGTLGLRLSGLSDRKSAIVHSPSGIRLVPVEKGTCYAALRNEEADVPLFVGHPFRAGDESLVLSLSRPVRWTLEVHNPTKREIRAKVESDPRCSAFSFCREVTIQAGESLDFAVE